MSNYRKSPPPAGILAGDDLYCMLTVRERQVAVDIARGIGMHDIARGLGISIKTVDTHRGHIMKKLRLAGNVVLAHLAIARGWVPLAHHVTAPGKESLAEAMKVEWPL